MNQPLRLMGVLAHPDDETLGMGGVYARYAAEGVETSLVTATLGQKGRFRGLPQGDPGHPGSDRLAEIRVEELKAAVAVLGIGECHLLGYMDGALDQVDPAVAVAAIAGHLRRFRPQVVMTFDPYGAYGHPDHIAICQFTTAAVVAAADPAYRNGATPEHPPHAVSKLYYMANDPAAWDAYQSAFKKLVSMVDGVERQANPWPDWSITTHVDTRAWWPTVWKAVTCHDSQVAGYETLKRLPPEHHEGLWGGRSFYRAFSTVNGGRTRESDLFEGLRQPATGEPVR